MFLDAARLKARFPIAHADAFAAATAIRMNAVIVTGDPEFHRIEHLVTINWL
jgi:ribonuclease VapC